MRADDQLAIARKVEAVIRRHGVPTHVRKLVPFRTRLALTLPREAFLKTLSEYVRRYHSHSTLIIKSTIATDASSTQKPKTKPRRGWDPAHLRPPPKLSYYGGVLTIRLFTFLSHLDSPALVKRDWDAQVRVVRGAIKRAKHDDAKIVLDLRLHSGGNYGPVVDMFQDLFRGMTLYAWCNELPTSRSRAWTTVPPDPQGPYTWMEQHGSYSDISKRGRFASGEFSYPCHVAVLIGDMTYSSGEIVASMFVGKQGVRFFGSKSGGGLSVNEGRTIVPGWLEVNLTTVLVATTDGVMHFDEVLSPDVFTKQPLQDARAWLKSQGVAGSQP